MNKIVVSPSEMLEIKQHEEFEALTKGKALPEGTVRTWKGKEYTKVGGKWKPKSGKSHHDPEGTTGAEGKRFFEHYESGKVSKHGKSEKDSLLHGKYSKAHARHANNMFFEFHRAGKTPTERDFVAYAEKTNTDVAKLKAHYKNEKDRFEHNEAVFDKLKESKEYGPKEHAKVIAKAARQMHKKEHAEKMNYKDTPETEAASWEKNKGKYGKKAAELLSSQVKGNPKFDAKSSSSSQNKKNKALRSFNFGYNLESIQEVENYIAKNYKVVEARELTAAQQANPTKYGIDAVKSAEMGDDVMGHLAVYSSKLKNDEKFKLLAAAAK